ncbi:tetratricopeptide repeat protein [Nitrosophilus alvini]|uniref:tetratricopeptide repeat protein n=1 Tax=Nitrosophilus alvini TaxID=2714855 RepID=UPI00190CDAEC|nr:glycosyltransferase [Nitrosophilus alvini]
MKKISLCVINSISESEENSRCKESILQNLENIYEVISLNPLDIPKNIVLKTESKNEADIRNEMIRTSKGDYLLWIDNATQFEDSTIEEYIEILEEKDTDIIYPNEIIINSRKEERVVNHSSWEEKESELLQTLNIENEIPKWGVMTKKEIFDRYGFFEKDYDEFSFYAFLYKNIKNLRLSLSELSFVTNYAYETFTDTSLNSKLLREILNKYDIKEDIFVHLNWKNENIAYATVYTLIGDKLSEFKDFFNASEFYRKALLSFHNKESLKKLIDAYYNMGLFDEAKKLLEKQGLDSQESHNIKEKIESTEKLVKELENLVEQGKASDVLHTLNDILSVYKGAPIYNIFGIIFFIKQDLDTAFRFFYTAATLNPIDRDILYNIADIAKKIKREEEVSSLYYRLTK